MNGTISVAKSTPQAVTTPSVAGTCPLIHAASVNSRKAATVDDVIVSGAELEWTFPRFFPLPRASEQSARGRPVQFVQPI